jgi:hypothetical protein
LNPLVQRRDGCHGASPPTHQFAVPFGADNEQRWRLALHDSDGHFERDFETETCGLDRVSLSKSCFTASSTLRWHGRDTDEARRPAIEDVRTLPGTATAAARGR